MSKEKPKAVENVGTPGPGSTLGDGGTSVQGYFQEQDQVEGSRRNPKRFAPPKGKEDLISTVEACKLMNGIVGYLMYDPSGLYRDAGKTAPAAHEVDAGAMRFAKTECETFAREWKKRKAEQKRIKAEEAEFAKENEEFLKEAANAAQG